MEARVHIASRDDGGFDLVVRDADGQQFKSGAGRAFTRTLPGIGLRAKRYPLPDKATTDAIDAGEADVLALCRADDPKIIAQALQALQGVRIPKGAVRSVGRYLFEVAVGQALWDELLAVTPKAEELTISLVWPAAETSLQRLPWEMMSDANDFLATYPKVAVVRRPAGSKATVKQVSGPPRVLFVVGVDSDDQRILAGTEFLRLLHSLRGKALDLGMRTRLVLRASVNRIGAAIREFKPDVVHFICHGNAGPDGTSWIELVDERDKSNPAKVSAEELLNLLGRKPESLPAVVVLNACHSASVVEMGESSLPIAAALIEGGVPVAVGMAGRIADQACRLFTLGFYGALLETGSVAYASAMGRHAAVSQGGLSDPEKTIDWALPALYLSEAVSDDPIQVVEYAELRNWVTKGRLTLPKLGDLAFCDRIDAMAELERLLVSPAAEDAGGMKQALQILSVVAGPCLPKKNRPEPQLGRTWLLREFAHKALLEGHLPFLLQPKKHADENNEEKPDSFDELLEFIQCRGQEHAETMGIAGAYFEQVEKLIGVEPEAAELKNLKGPIGKAAGKKGKRADDAKAAALRLDLIAYLEAARKRFSPVLDENSKLVVLLDDAECLGAGAMNALVNHMLGPYGLANEEARRSVRLVLAYRESAGVGGIGNAQEFLETVANKHGAATLALTRFEDGVEARRAYEFHLLHWRDLEDEPKPLAIDRARRDAAEFLFGKICNYVNGVPSWLPPLTPLIDGQLGQNAALREANDDDRLKAVAGSGR
ncbi:MAG: CHAT domain-containing protein [Planctomycetota bacterium]